jgi:hypothetical protein
MAFKRETYKLAGKVIDVTHWHSDGDVTVSVNGHMVASIGHEEHENAVVTYENTKEILAALETELSK